MIKMQLMNARLLILVLLGGCASAPSGDLNETRNGWYGASYETAVLKWGAPTRSTVLPDGRDAHTWVSETVAGGTWFPSISVFGGNNGVGVGTGVFMGQGGGQIVRCERTFFFRGGRVVEQSWQGQSDYCGSFRRT
jgi:hypothetical protein